MAARVSILDLDSVCFISWASFLSGPFHTLGSSELPSPGPVGVCSVDVFTLNTELATCDLAVT